MAEDVESTPKMAGRGNFKKNGGIAQERPGPLIRYQWQRGIKTEDCKQYCGQLAIRGNL